MKSKSESSFKLTGRVNYKLFDAEGNLKDERNINNVVVTVGKVYLATWLTAASQAGFFMQYVGVGTGTTAANVADTTLETPLPTRIAGTLSSLAAVWQSVADFPAGTNTGAITESGIFSASSGGTMLARQVFPVINKGAGDSLQVTWQITIS